MSKFNKDSVLGTFIVIICFCLVCSVLVSSAVVALNPYKAAAVANDRQINILKVSGFDVQGSVADTYWLTKARVPKKSMLLISNHCQRSPSQA